MKFLSNVYLKLIREKLILFAILSVARQKEECTFERLVKECYILFPESFRFYRYPQWPDSLKLDHPLRTLRKKRYILGNPQTRYTLTKLGERYAVIVEKELSNEQLLLEKPSVIIGRKEKKLLDHLKSTGEFQRFLLKGGNFNIDRTQIIRLSFSTMDTPAKSIIKNLEFLKELSKEAQEKNLEDFINFCIERFYGKK